MFWRIVIVLIDRARRPDRVGRPRDLLDDVAQLGQLGPQVVVHVDEVLRRGLLLRRCTPRPGRHGVASAGVPRPTALRR